MIRMVTLQQILYVLIWSDLVYVIDQSEIITHEAPWSTMKHSLLLVFALSLLKAAF